MYTKCFLWYTFILSPSISLLQSLSFNLSPSLSPLSLYVFRGVLHRVIPAEVSQEALKLNRRHRHNHPHHHPHRPQQQHGGGSRLRREGDSIVRFREVLTTTVQRGQDRRERGGLAPQNASFRKRYIIYMQIIYIIHI